MNKGDRDLTPSQSIALWADKLRDMSASGLRFSKDIHDQENYQAIQTIAMEMFALATGNSSEQIEPLRAPIFNRRTPLAIGDAAVINGDGQLLLMQRAGSRRWALPGGAFAVGETPAEGIVREVLEETGIKCKPVSLVGIYDSQRGAGISPQHQYNIVLLCQHLNEQVEEASHLLESLDYGWFAEDDFPAPLEPSHQQRIQDAYRTWRGNDRAYFNGMGDL